jgi:hypothetical protein
VLLRQDEDTKRSAAGVKTGSGFLKNFLQIFSSNGDVVFHMY